MMPGEPKVKVGDLIWWNKSTLTLSLIIDLAITHECGDDGLHLCRTWHLAAQKIVPFYIYPIAPGAWTVATQEELSND